MVRKKDRFWDHVEEQNNGRFKCKYCESIFAGGATRIKYHLAGAKGHDINICTKVPQEVQEEASLTVGEPNKKLKGASTSNKDKEREISLTSISNDDMLSGVFEKSKAEYIAKILLGVFVEGLLAKLRSIVIEQHISFELDFKEGLTDLLSGLTDLFSFLTQIQLVLNDVEKRQASDELLRSWLAELRRVAYDIDDVLDEFGYNILQQKVLNYSSPSIDIINMANEIKIIYESLNRLKGDMASYELRAEFVNSIPEISFNMEIDSFLDDSKVNQNVGNNIVEATYCDRVTEITETFTQYELTEYECWFIFKKRASANERLLALDLEKIEKEIVKKSYCAIFPKDYNMKKDEVIQHWMAEGFLELSKEGNTVIEDIGNTYFNILLATSFFQNARKDAYGDSISCKMHNLVHDFAISISKSEILILEGGFVDNVSKVQPLFVQSDGKTTPRTLFSGDSFIKMRTLISENLDFDGMLSSFKCLRVLKLSGYSIIRFPNSIEQLIHLRLLHILDTEIEESPKSITKLYNLQTLRIEECPKLMKLPEDLSNLINLRHISINIGCLIRFWYRDSLLKNMGRLTCLQTLKFFGVGQDEGYRIKEMGPLKNLRREKNIYNLENVKDEEEAKSAKLKEKEIFKLGLFWSPFSRQLDSYDKDEKVLEGLHPHPNLKSLTIGWVLEIKEMRNVRSIGSEFYSYSDGSYRNITTLFPALRILKLVGMDSLEEWKDAKELTSVGVLSVIRHLEIVGCGIDELTSGPQFCASLLQYLKIEYCPNLKSIPDLEKVFHSLINLKLSNSPDLRLKLSRREGRLKTLVIEELDAFPSLRYTSIRSSHASLKKLRLRGWPTLNSQFLMDEIRHFTAFEELCIENFNGMEALPDWLCYLSSLQNLCLSYCKKLMRLPILGLTNLKHLHIAYCPNLEKRCAEGSGAEWFKIAHIPNIKINRKYIKGRILRTLTTSLTLTSLKLLGIFIS
uniref:BED-type domain-containing protein n=2 Tax=Quercus lobata TaxID=97700 RepID=A0A7N2MSL1_QUELO